ncbi:type 1 glutamine amidotransferase [Brachybacterium halotolerans subsp. kimchii]|uniref:type 1 glutamine amidotransferase domain-containing protein n=1 Tax=Brachybacterium halotolerans TaxID=2795215 RepID=UPI001E2D26BB|nr:type 1 glutamine amidotransferase domain-containing protein [Brachybacterium halotolerans]UEJ84351.1 type 1 glutamine amidotransferase [Brachybacterium halotolerans subsp. kimchii]
MTDLTGRTIALIANRGVEEPELAKPLAAFQEAGAKTVLLSAEDATVVALNGDWDRGKEFPVDGPIKGASADDFDALVLPGGTLNADSLRIDEDAVGLVKAFAAAGKPIAAICHAPWILIEAGLVDGLRMTSFASVATDLRNAGADWVDEQVVTDRGITTSRNPGDLDAFNAEVIARLAG